VLAAVKGQHLVAGGMQPRDEAVQLTPVAAAAVHGQDAAHGRTHAATAVQRRRVRRDVPPTQRGRPLAALRRRHRRRELDVAVRQLKVL
jgi:hypothetical protein